MILSLIRYKKTTLKIPPNRAETAETIVSGVTRSLARLSITRRRFSVVIRFSFFVLPSRVFRTTHPLRCTRNFHRKRTINGAAAPRRDDIVTGQGPTGTRREGAGERSFDTPRDDALARATAVADAPDAIVRARLSREKSSRVAREKSPNDFRPKARWILIIHDLTQSLLLGIQHSQPAHAPAAADSLINERRRKNNNKPGRAKF